MIFEKAAQSLVWHRIERIIRGIDYVVYSILKIGEKNKLKNKILCFDGKSQEANRIRGEPIL